MGVLDTMTLEELTWAYRARRMEAWNHTAFLCASLIQAFTGARDIDMNDFHPILAAEKTAKTISQDDVPQFLPETLSPEEIDRRWEAYERDRFGKQD